MKTSFLVAAGIMVGIVVAIAGVLYLLVRVAGYLLQGYSIH